MGRNINLTDKLGLEAQPTITIGDKVLTVDNSAANMLQILDLIGDSTDGVSVKAILEASNLIFEPKSRKVLDGMKLSFPDFATVVSAAIDLVLGDDEGNEVTPATTS